MKDISVAEWRAKWKAKVANLRAELEMEFSDIPQAARDDVWNYAYADGHSSGLNGIETCYRDIAPIVEKAVKAVVS